MNDCSKILIITRLITAAKFILKESPRRSWPLSSLVPLRRAACSVLVQERYSLLADSRACLVFNHLSLFRFLHYHILMAPKSGKRSRKAKAIVDEGVDQLTGKTDARHAADKLDQQLLQSYFIGFGTLNFEKGASNPDSGKQERCLQWATQNVRPLNAQHVENIAKRMQSAFITDGNRTAINLPIKRSWLRPESLQQIESTKTPDWTHVNAITDLPKALIRYTAIPSKDLKPMSGHVRPPVEPSLSD
jgi:hypothetical protein